MNPNSGDSTNAWPIPATIMAGAIDTGSTVGQVCHSVNASPVSPTAWISAPMVSTVGPNRATIRAVKSDASRNDTAIGSSASPDWNGLRWAPCWNVSADTNMNAEKPVKNGTAISRPRCMPGSRSIEGGTIGWWPVRSSRRSTSANAAPSGTTAASMAMLQAGQPSERPSVSGTSSASSVAASSSVPGTSIRCGSLRVGDRNCPPGQEQPDDADRHVDQEDQPPLGAGQVGRDQRAAGQLADRRGDAGGGAVEADRLDPGLADAGGLDGGQHLRHHEGGRGALQRPERHQRPGGRRQPAQQREDGEAGHAQHEQPAAAEQVAEAAAQHQQQCVGHAVACHHQLQRGGRGVQVCVDGRKCDVDDEEVGDGQEGAQQHRRQPKP